MRAVMLAVFALCGFIAGAVFAAFEIPVESMDTFVLSTGIIGGVFATLSALIVVLWNKSDGSVKDDHDEQSDAGASTLPDSGRMKAGRRDRSGLEVLNVLTIAAKEAANSAATGAAHSALASRRAAAAAKEAAGKSMENVAEAAAAAATEAAQAAKQSVTAAKGALEAVAAAVEYQAEFSLLQAETQTAAALKQASESAAEAVRMAHAASAFLKTKSASPLPSASLLPNN
jgi:hypothetical protein